MDRVTGSTPDATAQWLASSHTSLMHGWVPITVQVVTGIVLTLAVGWRSPRWRMVWLPLAALVGGSAAYGAHWYLVDRGLSEEPAPLALWLWIAMAGLAAAVLILGWRSAHRWRRAATLVAIPLCLLSAVLVLNLWIGYFPTVQSAWNQLTSGPLPDQTDQATVTAMAAKGARPPHGSVIQVAIPSDASHFKHRGELVYLPPEWFASSPPPPLPTVMMIAGQFNTPADWTRAGNAIRTMDSFAAAHDGKAPVLVFVDSGGAFNNDTECVNGIRGNAADHLTKDVVPYMVSAFGVSSDRSNWGVAGWSMGGTCAVDLTVMHPEKFSAFLDVAGDYFPNAGQQDANHRPTVRRKRRRLGDIRPEHGDRPARPVQPRGRLVRDLVGRLGGATPRVRNHRYRFDASGRPRGRSQPEQSNRGCLLALCARPRQRH